MANLEKDGKAKDEDFMKLAMDEARRASSIGEVPIGAVAVVDGAVVAQAHNLRETTQDPLGHAEVLLIQKLSAGERRWRLSDVIIYVTCEPCLMCMGAMLQARISRVVYGCRDPKAGACGSLYDVSNDSRLNHRIAVTPDICAADCGKLLSDFFRAKRK